MREQNILEALQSYEVSIYQFLPNSASDVNFLPDMPENEREKEQNRMKEYKDKFQSTLSQIKDTKAKFGIK